MPTHILSCGRDAVLMDTRRRVLQSAGYIVTNALTQSEFTSAFLSGDFDIVVLCHTIPLHGMRSMMGLVVRQSPSTPVIVVSNLAGQTFPFGLTVPNNPVDLLSVVKHASEARP